MSKESIISKKSFEFAIQVVKLCKTLQTKREFVIADQLLRSSTSIGANVIEASAAQTKKDFIAKMAIASKEARETHYWLLLIKEMDVIDINLSGYLDNADELIRLLTATVKTAMKREQLNTKH
jgi:four helix bundle protein